MLVEHRRPRRRERSWAMCFVDRLLRLLRRINGQIRTSCPRHRPRCPRFNFQKVKRTALRRLRRPRARKVLRRIRSLAACSKERFSLAWALRDREPFPRPQRRRNQDLIKSRPRRQALRRGHRSSRPHPPRKQQDRRVRVRQRPQVPLRRLLPHSRSQPTICRLPHRLNLRRLYLRQPHPRQLQFNQVLLLQKWNRPHPHHRQRKGQPCRLLS